MDRRAFLKHTASLFSALSLVSCAAWEKLLTKRFKELSQEEVKELIRYWEKEYEKKFRTTISVEGTPPLPRTKFGYGLDLSLCIGCRRCVYACVKENNQSRDPAIHWITVLEMKKGDEGIHLLKGNPYYPAEQVPREGYFYIPVQCQQCDNPPCVKTCPVGATWKEPDGIVVIDYDWCIGCRCCMAACPYGARHFNWAEPSYPPLVQLLCKVQLPTEEMIEEEEAYDYLGFLDQGRLSDPLVSELIRQKVFLTRKAKVKVVVKGKQWKVSEKENVYLFHYNEREKCLLISEIVEGLNPNTHYLGNRPRPRGVVEKCTFCIQRVRKGLYPACFEACPVGARKFGNLLDPNSEIRRVLETKRVFVLKGELNTKPSFFYFFSRG